MIPCRAKRPYIENLWEYHNPPPPPPPPSKKKQPQENYWTESDKLAGISPNSVCRSLSNNTRPGPHAAPDTSVLVHGLLTSCFRTFFSTFFSTSNGMVHIQYPKCYCSNAVWSLIVSTNRLNWPGNHQINTGQSNTMSNSAHKLPTIWPTEIHLVFAPFQFLENFGLWKLF